jgi:hypothetical protein
MARVINLENALDRLTLRVQTLEDAVFESDNDTTVMDAESEEEDAEDEVTEE